MTIPAAAQNGIIYIPANSADFGAAITSALTSQCTKDSNGYQQCTIILPAVNGGAWKTTVTITSPGVSLIGQGGYASVFDCSVAGDCLRIYTNPFTVQKAGHYQGFALVGNASANSVGVHLGEIESSYWEDIDILNFTGTGSACMKLDNQHTFGSPATATWTEGNVFIGIHLQNCSTLLSFTQEAVTSGNTSFGYNRFFDLKLNTDVNAGYVGISLGAGASLYNSTIFATINAGPNSTAPSGDVFYLAPAKGSVGAADYTGNLNLFGEGYAAHLIDLSAGASLHLRGASAMAWAGGAPPNNLAGTADWIIGTPQDANGTQVPLASTVPLILQTPSMLNGASSNSTNSPNTPVYLQPDWGATAGFLAGFTYNLFFNPADENWHTGTDGGNNGAWAWLGTDNGYSCFYSVPTNAPSSGQIITPSSFSSFCKFNIDPEGNIAAVGNVTAASGSNVVYRCTTAGTLPVGALTTTQSECGASSDTGLRVR